MILDPSFDMTSTDLTTPDDRTMDERARDTTITQAPGRGGLAVTLGIATREAIAIDQARAALSKVTPPGAWALVEARVIREQRRGATLLMALQRVHGWIASGWWVP